MKTMPLINDPELADAVRVLSNSMPSNPETVMAAAIRVVDRYREVRDGEGSAEAEPPTETPALRCDCRFAPLGTTTCDECKHSLGCDVHMAHRRTAPPAETEARGTPEMQELKTLRERKNQDFDGCATLDNAELDALLAVVEAADLLSVIHKSNQLFDALGRLKVQLRLAAPATQPSK